jgi:diguanylate cyclase (GGDEF)-like protein
MRLPRLGRRLPARLSLTQQVALLSLIPTVALGLVLTRVLQDQIVTRTLADAGQSAQLIAHIGIQPSLSPRTLRGGLGPSGVRALDRALSGRTVTQNLARIKIWNSQYKAIYSDDHSIIGQTPSPSDELVRALAGRPPSPRVVTPKPHEEESSELGLGQLVEAYVPLRFAASGPPEGAFEIYLHYGPIAAAIARDKRTIVFVVTGGLALLWAVLFRIVVRASRRLRRSARENYELAHYDRLTGLPNRTLFIAELARTLRRADTGGDVAAVLIIDLDGFKEINNTLGNATGDRVLREVSRRLRHDVGADAVVARLGGDEYAVLCRRTEGVPGALATAAAVQSSLEPAITLAGVALDVEASIGIAVSDERGESPDELLQRADAALARAKALRSRIEVYSPERDSFDASKLMLLGQVRQALEREEFILDYQPQLDLKSGRVTGVEALLRWRHPERGLLAPMTFIPLVEQTALIAPLTQYVLTRALRQLVTWREAGVDLEMSVNLSARSLLDPDLPGQVACLLSRHGVPATLLKVEVTESATVLDHERAVEVLRCLRSTGVGVAIDDFGTGNASIAYLTSLPVSEIKIDKSFITNICEDERAQAIVRSTIDLARHLDLHVVAEGVETPAALEKVRELGCHTAQGYVLAPPLAPAGLATWLKERTERMPRSAPASSPGADGARAARPGGAGGALAVQRAPRKAAQTGRARASAPRRSSAR